jgi:hypothetical protein
VGKEEEVTRVRFVASDGWWSTGGRPAGGVQAGWPRCGSALVVLRSGRGTVGAGRFGRPCGAVGLQQDRRHELEKGKKLAGRPWRGGSQLFRPARSRPCTGRRICLNRQQGRGRGLHLGVPTAAEAARGQRPQKARLTGG